MVNAENEPWDDSTQHGGGTRHGSRDARVAYKEGVKRAHAMRADTRAYDLMAWFRDQLSAELFGINCQVVGDPKAFAIAIANMRREQGVDYVTQRAMMQEFFRDVRARTVPVEKRDLWRDFLARRQAYLERAAAVTEQLPTRPTTFNFI